MAIYYIKNGGNDNLDGLSDANAWATITRVNSASFNAGDTVCFNKGDIWRETLTVPSSGASDNYITFSNYGVGINPRILGSIQATTWANQGSNIWKSSTIVSNPGTTCQIFFTELNGSISWGHRRTNSSSCTTEYDWVWLTNNIYVYSPTDPTSRYTNIEVPQRYAAIQLNDKQYITIDGIDIFYTTTDGISYLTYPMFNLSGMLIQNMEIAYLGSRVPGEEVGYGTSLVYSNMIIRNCIVHDCGRRSISLNLYANSFTANNILVEGCQFYHGSHTTSVDMNMNTGSFSASLNNITIRKCLIWDEPNWPYFSTQLFAQNSHTGSGSFTNLYIYDNIFKYPISGGSIQSEYVDGMYIYNNTFYGHNASNGNTYFFYPYHCTNVKLKNNVFYTPLSFDTNAAGLAIYVPTNSSYNQIDADYNTYYRINNSLRIIIANGTNYYMNNKSTINSGLGWEMHGIFADPILTSSSDYHLQAGSPAIGSGVYLNGLVDTDFEGNVRNNPPSIGAYEYGSNPPTTTSGGLTLTVGSTSITNIKVGSTQITKVIRNGITYWQV